MPDTDASIIQQILAPVVVISACALLCLSTSARLTAILSRIRGFHQERIEAFQIEPGKDERADRVRAMRLEGLEEQTHRLIRRAALIRNALLLLFFAIICMLISSLVLGLSTIVDGVQPAAIVMFVVGVISMLIAMILSLAEIGAALKTVRYEHSRVASLDSSPPDVTPRTEPDGERRE